MVWDLLGLSISWKKITLSASRKVANYWIAPIPLAINMLVKLMREGKDERVRGTAAHALLDRGWSKTKAEVVAGAEGSYLDVLKAVNKSMLAKRNETQTWG